MEHRWGERTPVDIPVRLRAHGGGVATGWLADVSRSGAFIRTWRKLAPLTRVDVVIDEHPVPAFVVRDTADGIGMEWCDLAPDIVSAGLLESHAPPPLAGGAARQVVAAAA